MYLNIINSINVENKRKSKNFSYEKEEVIEEENNTEEADKRTNLKLKSYYSIFYGELTNNWIYLRSKN